MNNQTLYERFCDKVLTTVEPKLLITATLLPTGAIETQMNTDNLKEKIAYIHDTYDKDFKMKRVPEIQIIDFILV